MHINVRFYINNIQRKLPMNGRKYVPRTKRHVDAERILTIRFDGLIKAEGVSE